MKSKIVINLPEQLWSLDKNGRLINKKNRTGDWEYQKTRWNFIDGYIQDSDSKFVLALKENNKEPGTQVILARKTNSGLLPIWVNKTVYDKWFYIKLANSEMFLTAESNILTTVTGTYQLISN